MNRPKPPLPVICIFLLLCYWAVVMLIAISAPFDTAEFIFSENGIFERVSPYLWFALAALIGLLGRFAVPVRIALVAVTVLLGCREMDWHQTLFGESFLKTAFFRSATVLPEYKVAGALLVLLLAGLAVYLAKTFFSSLKSDTRAKLKQPAYGYLLLALALLAAGKFLDRLPAQLFELFDIAVSEKNAVLMRAWEESTEAVVPVLLAIAVWAHRPQRH